MILKGVLTYSFFFTYFFWHTVWLNYNVGEPIVSQLILNIPIMKKIFLTTLTVIFVALGMHAATTNYNNNKPFVFMESGIEFAVFTDGQFDFNLIQPSYTGVHVNTRNINFSYNSGHNYDPYIQYDHYGAVIQIENTPIFYDYYGRVQRIGNVNLNYNHRGLVRNIGNLYVSYNHYGHIINVNGFVNRYNRYCPNRDRYVYYRRPVANRVVVYHTPYRRNFAPNRCSYTVYRNNYYRNHRNNSVRRNFDRPGYNNSCLLYTSPSPRDGATSRMPSSA